MAQDRSWPPEARKRLSKLVSMSFLISVAKITHEEIIAEALLVWRCTPKFEKNYYQIGLTFDVSIATVHELQFIRFEYFLTLEPFLCPT